MRKLLFLSFAVCAFVTAGFSQKANYSGTWKLDVAASKLDARMRIESMTLTVAQTDKEVRVETLTKRLPPNDGPGAGRGFGGDGITAYPLDGRDTKAEVDGPMGKMPVTYKGGKEADGSLKLSSVRTFNGPNGEISVTTRETWKLSADGKTLTVDRENVSPRGTQTSTLVFVKG